MSTVTGGIGRLVLLVICWQSFQDEDLVTLQIISGLLCSWRQQGLDLRDTAFVLMIPLTTSLRFTVCFSLFFMHYHRSGCLFIQQVPFSENHLCMSHGYPRPGSFSLVLHSLRRSMQRVLYCLRWYLFRGFVYIGDMFLRIVSCLFWGLTIWM